MPARFRIHDLFKLDHGLTVLSCEAVDAVTPIDQRTATLVSGTQVRGPIRLIGERHLLNRQEHPERHAIETRDVVDLSKEEARSGAWTLVVER